MGTQTQPSLHLLVILVFCYFCEACGIDNAITNATRIIDESISDLNRNSAHWQNVLQDVARSLPDEVSKIVREEAQPLATPSIAQTGAQSSWSTDPIVAPSFIDLDTDPS